MFSKWCKTPLIYNVDGIVRKDGSIVLMGERDVYGKGCVYTGKTTVDVLEFNYLRKL